MRSSKSVAKREKNWKKKNKLEKEEQTEPKANRGKEITKIRAKVNEMEARKIRATKSDFF